MPKPTHRAFLNSTSLSLSDSFLHRLWGEAPDDIHLYPHWCKYYGYIQGDVPCRIHLLSSQCKCTLTTKWMFMQLWSVCKRNSKIRKQLWIPPLESKRWIVDFSSSISPLIGTRIGHMLSLMAGLVNNLILLPRIVKTRTSYSHFLILTMPWVSFGARSILWILVNFVLASSPKGVFGFKKFAKQQRCLVSTFKSSVFRWASMSATHTTDLEERHVRPCFFAGSDDKLKEKSREEIS